MSSLKEDPKQKSTHYFSKDGSGERGYCIYFSGKKFSAKENSFSSA